MNLLIPQDDVTRWFEAAHHDPVRATQIAVAELRDRAAAGDHQAATVLDAWLHGGARQDLKSAFRSRDQVLTLGKDVVIPRRFSVKTDDGHRQLRAWDEMTRAEFDGMLREYRAQTKHRTKLLRMFERVVKAWDASPHLATAADAFRAAGLDLSDVVQVAA